MRGARDDAGRSGQHGRALVAVERQAAAVVCGRQGSLRVRLLVASARDDERQRRASGAACGQKSLRVLQAVAPPCARAGAVSPRRSERRVTALWQPMFRTRSIAMLILIGLSVTLMPLIAAVVTAVVQVDRLAELSRTAVQEAEDVTSQSRRLLESLSEMRRPFLQYQVTGDEDFYGLYLERRAEFAASLRNLADRRLTGRGRAHLL